jgi:hypothetical protein
MEACEMDSAGSERAPVLGSCGHSHSPSVSVEGKDFLHELRECELLNRPLLSGAGRLASVFQIHFDVLVLQTVIFICNLPATSID